MIQGIKQVKNKPMARGAASTNCPAAELLYPNAKATVVTIKGPNAAMLPSSIASTENTDALISGPNNSVNMGLFVEYDGQEINNIVRANNPTYNNNEPVFIGMTKNMIRISGMP